MNYVRSVDSRLGIYDADNLHHLGQGGYALMNDRATKKQSVFPTSF